MPEKEYQRLTHARSRWPISFVFLSRSSLWLGKDHLLCVRNSSGYTETYKRFYFRDIQTISIMESKRWAVWNWILAVPTTICLALLIADGSSHQYWEHGVTVVYAICTALFGIPFLLNVLQGPTCVCYLRTAVQTEELPSLNRVRRAHTALERLRPFITSAQGELAPEEIAARMRQSVQGSESRVPDPAWETAAPGMNLEP